MVNQPDPAELCAQIRALKEIAEKLERMGETIPTVARNTARILASIKMLEINLCDVMEAEPPPYSKRA